MIKMVLDESINGTKAIRKYAEIEGKKKLWIDEIANLKQINVLKVLYRNLKRMK